MKDAVQHLLFVFFQHAGFLTGRHQHLQLFFRVHRAMAARLAQTEQIDDGASCAIQDVDERTQHPLEQLRGLHHEHGRLFGALQRDRFRHELAKHDVKRGDHDERNRGGDGVRRGERDGGRQRREGRQDDRGNRGLADPPEAQARHRDADLRGRNERGRVVQRAPHRLRQAAAFRDELIDAGLAHRHERKLGGHEKPVGQNQGEDREQGESCVHCLTLRRAMLAGKKFSVFSLKTYAFLLEKKCASTNSSIAA